MFSPPLNFIPSPWRRWLRLVLVLTWFLVIVFGFLHRISHSWDTRTLWIVDNSLSMLASDIRSGSGMMISRLDLAKHIITTKSQDMPGEQAIMTSSYLARVELPMTEDMVQFREFVRGINPIIYGGGTTAMSVLRLIDELYGQGGITIYWITDGEFSDVPIDITRKYPITLIGVGSQQGAPIIEWYDSDGRARYKMSAGKRVNTIRDDVSLSRLSTMMGSSLILLDQQVTPDLPQQIRYSDQISFPWAEFVWVLLVFSGLIVPKYHYIHY